MRDWREKSQDRLRWERSTPKRCFICGRRRTLSVNHIERRSQCHRPHQDWPENLAWVCLTVPYPSLLKWPLADKLRGLTCHNAMEQMELAEALALKWSRDRCGHPNLDSFLSRFLQVRDGPVVKAKNRMTVEEVEHFLRKAA